ncbi:four helix bundle protein [Subsaximicrobium wynnwilliamsii]|jgi:four helix bundle protein|nr:four helix bundle protein [Subsaximicrobium wynnwilliamsii]
MIKSYKDLKVHQAAFSLAMELCWLTRKFPKEEIHSLRSQVVRCSRTVSANISEGWAKREYEAVFKQQLINALGSNAETENWLNYAIECKYIEQSVFERVLKQNDEIGKMLTKLHKNWTTYEK